MKQIIRTNLRVSVPVALAMILSMSSLYSEANAVQKTATPHATSSRLTEPVSEAELDGQGNVDMVSPALPSSQEGEKGIVSQASLLIDGDQYPLADNALIHDEQLRDISVDDIKPGNYVGFKKDPSDKIRELWIMKTETKKDQEKKLEKPEPVLEVPGGSGGEIRKEGGVWVN